MTDLNFESEPFSGYRFPHEENKDPMENFGGAVGIMNLKHAGFLHGVGGHHQKFGGSSRRWRWLHRNQYGAGASAQDQQSLGWAQNCLAQLTGGRPSHNGRMDHGTRRAIRKFQMQQQLSPTGRLDSDTLAALQDACGGEGGDADSQEVQAGRGVNAPPEPFRLWPSEIQHQTGPTPQTPGMDGHQSFELWFEWNSTKLRQDMEVDSVAQLAFVIKGVSDHLRAAGRAGKIVVRGFASQEGAEAHNRTLSRQRADRIKSLLVDAGVTEDRIEVTSGGPSNAWPGGLKWNRRVEIDLQP